MPDSVAHHPPTVLGRKRKAQDDVRARTGVDCGQNESRQMLPLGTPVRGPKQAGRLVPCEPTVPRRGLLGKADLACGGQVALNMGIVDRGLKGAQFLAHRSGRLVSGLAVASANAAVDASDRQVAQDRKQCLDRITDPLRCFDRRRVLLAVDGQSIGDGHSIWCSWAAVGRSRSAIKRASAASASRRFRVPVVMNRAPSWIEKMPERRS